VFEKKLYMLSNF